MFRQTVRDFCVNQQFRRDYWVKGARQVTATEQVDAFRATRVILATPRVDMTLKVTGSLSEAAMNEDVYGPILEFLADHQPHTLGEIEQAMAGESKLSQMKQAAMILIGSGSLLAVQDEAITAKARISCDKLNLRLIDMARGSGDINYLASPVTGGGIAVNRFQQLFLLAMRQGKEQPADWATFTWQSLASQNQRVLKDSVALETDEENLAELTAQAKAFAEKQLPILRKLQVV